MHRKESDAEKEPAGGRMRAHHPSFLRILSADEESLSHRLYTARRLCYNEGTGRWPERNVEISISEGANP